MNSQLIMASALLLMACGPTPPRASEPAGSSGVAPGIQHPSGPKTIVFGVPADFNGFVMQFGLNGPTTITSNMLHQFLDTTLTVRDQNSNIAALLATQVPSLDDGSWVVNPDGTMQVTWHLRRGWLWQDGKELTSDDVRFGWEVDSAVATPAGIVARQIERLDTLDPYTVVMHWKVTSQNGNELGYREFDVLPRHVLGAAFEADKDSISNHPYLVDPSVFVGAGPFVPTEWDRGSQLTVVAFDKYALGRPKIDRVIFKVVTNYPTMLANVLAGSVDMTLNALDASSAQSIMEEWSRTKAGTVLMQPTTMRILIPQFRPEFASPRDLVDPRVRKALYFGLDRAAVAEANGMPSDYVANSSAVPGMPVFAVVDPVLVKYTYDPTRALTLLQEVGWQRGADGKLTKGGQTFEINFIEVAKANVFQIAEQNYSQIGATATYTVGVAADLRALAEFGGFQSAGTGINGLINWVSRYESERIATPANRHSGTNAGGYSNPVTDQAIARLKSSLRPEDQYRAYADAWRQISDDVGTISLHYVPVPYTGRKGITGWQPTSPQGEVAYAPHLWDVS